jgi:hypothetical protein
LNPQLKSLLIRSLSPKSSRPCHCIIAASHTSNGL